MNVPNGHLDYWTLQKLLGMLNATTAPTVVTTPEVTAAQFAALQARVAALEALVATLSTAVYSARTSVIANYTTHRLHRLWLVNQGTDENPIWDIQAEQSPS